MSEIICKLGDPVGNMKADLVVIGGGIIGLAVAEKMIAEGRDVTLIEKSDIAAGASRNNAAGLAFSEVLPMASVGNIQKALLWLVQPLGPFTIVPRHAPKVIPWLLRFLMAAWPSTRLANTNTQSELMKLGRKAYDDLLARRKLKRFVRNDGALSLYQSKSSYRAGLRDWKSKAEYGVKWQSYEGEALHEFQPGLDHKFVGGVHTKNWYNISNPEKFCQAIHQKITKAGLTSLLGEITHIIPNDDGVELQLRDGTLITAKQVVLAAGPWSVPLAKKLGDNVPLVCERGYNTTFKKSAYPNLKRTLIFSDHGFLMVALADGVRIGGASEIASMDTQPNFERAEYMLKKAKTFVPAFHADENDGVQWMGTRPSLPDSLPIIGPSTASDKICYAFGHGHLGMTQAAATAVLVCQILTGKKPPMDITPLRVNRF